MSNMWDHIASGCLVALAGVFTLWGGSLLFRALDGDRFTLRGRTEGRWINRISRRLLCLALVSIALGGALGLAALVAATGVRHLLWHAVSTGVATLAVVVLAWSWAGRRSAGRRRCPRCGYDTSATPTDTCPECGFVAQTPGMWHKPRKRRRGLIMGAALALAAAALIAVPLTIGYGWRRLIPTNVMIAGLGVLPDSIAGGDPSLYYRGAPAGSLAWRVYSNQLSAEQVQTLQRKIESQIITATDAADLSRTLALAAQMPIRLEPRFTPETAQAFVERALLGADTQTSPSWISMAPVDWNHLAAWQGAPAQRASTRLVERASTSPATEVNIVRMIAAAELAPDPVDVLLGLVDAASLGRPTQNESVAAGAVIRAVCESRGQSIAINAAERWLTETDEPTRMQLLRILAMSRRGPANLPPDLRARVWNRLLQDLAARIPEVEDIARLDSPVVVSIWLAVNDLMEQADVDALSAALRAGVPGSTDIALLACARFEETTSIDPSLLIGLMQDQDPRVRAAAIRSVTYNWIAYKVAFATTGASYDAFEKAALDLAPDPINADLIEFIQEQADLNNIED